LHEEPDFAPVPRLQIVTVEEAMRLRDRAVQLPARRDDAFKRAAREEVPERQGKLGGTCACGPACPRDPGLRLAAGAAIT
jgi:hypothetical protein